MLRIALAILLMPTSAFAARFSVELPAEVDLRRAAPCAHLACDLRIDQRLMHSIRGLRLEERSDVFAPSVPLVFNEAFIVRSRYGGSYRVRVLAEGVGRVW